MRQLTLDIRTAAHAVFASYYAGRNALAVATLQGAAAGQGPQVTWLHGPTEVGKSHLLQAAVTLAHERGAATGYLPLADFSGEVAVLDGLGALDLVALDDLDAVAGNSAWERRLFRLYEELLPRGGRLLVAARLPPGGSRIELADLRSRLSAGAVFALEPLSDEECLQALRLRAAWRGFALPEETGRFLLARVERDPGSLFQLLDRLDQASLAAHKRLTVPFVRSVLEGGS